MNLKRNFFRKKLVAAAAVVTTAAFALCGCSTPVAGKGNIANDVSGNSAYRETIYFWYSDENLTNYVNSAAVAFGEQEGVRVIPTLSAEKEYLEAINDATLHSGQGPDVYLLTNDLLGKAYLAGLASEIMDEKDVCSPEHFPQAALSAVTYKGKKIAYPLSYETAILVYNETYLEEWARQQAQRVSESNEDFDSNEDFEIDEDFETDEDLWTDEEPVAEMDYDDYMEAAVPATVDDILNIANTFDVPETVEGVMKWDVSDILYNYWFVGSYVDVGGASGDDPTRVDIHNAESTRCLEVYQNMNQFFSIESSTVTYDSVVEDFIAGKTVFTIATTDIVKRLEEAKEEGAFPYEYGIATLPDVGVDLASRSMSVTNTVVVNGYSAHKDLANRFAQYLADTAAVDLYARTGKVPASLAVAEENPALQILMLEYADSVPLPKLLETENFWMHLEVLFSKVWNGADVTEALQELSDQMNIQMGNQS